MDVVDPVQSIWYGFGFTTLILGDKVSDVSLSPNKSFRVVIVQLRSTWGDQNYELRLQKKGEWKTSTIFESGDVGGTVGRERIVWSSDSSQFILITSSRYGGMRPNECLPLLQEKERILFLYSISANQTQPITRNSLKKFSQCKF